MTSKEGWGGEGNNGNYQIAPKLLEETAICQFPILNLEKFSVENQNRMYFDYYFQNKKYLKTCIFDTKYIENEYFKYLYFQN